MPNWLLSCLAREWSGLAIAAILAPGGWLVGGWLGMVMIGIALVLGFGNVWHLIFRAHIGRLHPAPGRRIDLGAIPFTFSLKGNVRIESRLSCSGRPCPRVGDVPSP